MPGCWTTRAGLSLGQTIMTTNALAELEPDAPTAKRAQYEAFEFALEAPGLLRVTNGSYGDDEKADHSYTV